VKVSGGNFIISPGNERLDDLTKALKNAKPGDVISAKVLRILDKSAILQIRGVRVRADFPDGLPEQGREVSLLFKSKSRSGFVFSMQKEGRDSFLPEELKPMFLSGENKTSPYEMARFIGQTKPGLFEFNLFLLGCGKSFERNRKRSVIFQNMINRGLSTGAATYLSAMSNSDHSQLIFLYLLKYIVKNDGGTYINDNVEDEIEEFFKSGNDDLLKQYLDDLASDHDFSTGILFIDDGDNPKQVKYASNDNSTVMEMNLSALGRIVTVFHRDMESKNLYLHFYLEKEESIDFLKQRNPELVDKMVEIGIGKNLILYNNLQKSVDKLSDWSTDFYIKRDLDVKV